MKITKIIIILSLLFFNNACKAQSTDFEGVWLSKKNKIEIIKNGYSYIVKVNSKKYPAEIKDNLLVISAQMPIKASIFDDKLIINGDEYIRENKFRTEQKMEYINEGKTKLKDMLSKIAETYTQKNRIVEKIFIMLKGKINYSLYDKFIKLKNVPSNFEINEKNLNHYINTQNEITELVKRLIINAEMYPKIRNSSYFKENMSQLEDIENKLNVLINRFNNIADTYNKYGANLPKIKKKKEKKERPPKIRF